VVEKAYRRKTSGLEDADELCFQQSTGDSTSPEVDVSKGAVGKDFANDDVGDLRATATLQYPCDLADSPCLVRHKVEHAIGDDDIDRRVLDRQIRRITITDIDVSKAATLSPCERPLAHGDRHIYADRTAVRTSLSGSEK
jgi:hypothetical protein